MSSLTVKTKLRGGYYTPKPIADFLAAWAIQSPESEVLEPSCGDGIILEAAVEALKRRGASQDQIGAQIRGIEFDEVEALKAYTRLQDLNLITPNITIHDFFDYSQSFFNNGKRFDVVIGNPPFIRYQDFPEGQRNIALKLMRDAGLNPTRLTNSWVAFLVISSALLKSCGRLAMVIPAELFQVNYAAEIREFLSNFYQQIVIVTFNNLVFDGIQEEVVLLLCKKNDSAHEGIDVIGLNDLTDLSTLKIKDFPYNELKPIDHTSEKWTKYFLRTDEILLLRELRKHPDLILSGEAIDVDVGIVTGQNKYFILNESKVNNEELRDHAIEIVTRTPHIKGVEFTQDDWIEICRKGLPAFMFSPYNAPIDQQPSCVQRYICKGEEDGVHTGYKCRIRQHWYVVPSVWTPDAFFLRQVHKYPKIVMNRTNATCTDTIHRVRFINGYSGEFVTAAFLNSLTFAFSEITGRSYGGGVLTFEPSEAETLPIALKGAEYLDLGAINQLTRSHGIEEVLNITNKQLLKDGLGLNDKEIKTLHYIWEKLRNRRINRKNSRHKRVAV